MNSVVQDFDEKYNEAYRCWNEWYPERELDLRFYLGDQWSGDELQYLREEGRNRLTINHIKPNIDAISGKQRQSRLSSVTQPQIPQLQKASDQFSKLLLSVMSQCDGYHTISECFTGALRTGLNLACCYPDYSTDAADGDIQIKREPYNTFMLDPYFTKLDLSDCRYILRRRYLSKEQVRSLVPGAKNLEAIGNMEGNDDKFTFMLESRKPTGQKLFTYDEYWKQVQRKAYRIIDMEQGKSFTVDKIPPEAKEFLQSAENFEVIKFYKPGIELNVIVNGQHVETFQDPYGLDEYPFTAFVANFNPESDDFTMRLQSQVTQMRDAQRESNRRRSQIIDIVESQMNSGWIYEDGSIADPKQLMRTGQGKIIKTEMGRLNAIQRINPANVNAAFFTTKDMFDSDIMKTGNVTEELMGMENTGRTAGVTVMARQGAGLIRQQDLFDNLRLSQKSLSKKVLKLIQQWSPMKVKLLIGEDPDPMFYDSEMSKYDIVLQEAMLTDHQKQLRFAQLVELRQMGVAIPDDEMIAVAPIQGAGDLQQKVAQLQQQQAQAAQQVQMIEMQKIDAEIKVNQAKTVADLAMAKERESRAISNAGLEAERVSESVENRAKASLERAKAMRELDEMDDNKLHRALQLIQMFDAATKQEEQQTRKDDIQIPEVVAEKNQQQTASPTTEQLQNEQEPMPLQDPQSRRAQTAPEMTDPLDREMPT